MGHGACTDAARAHSRRARARSAELLERTGKNEQAEALFTQIVALKRETPGPDDAIVVERLAGLLAARGKRDDAVKLLRESLQRATDAHGAYHPAAQDAGGSLARLLWRCGRLVDALPVFRELVASLQATGLLREPASQEHRLDMALLLRRTADWAGAEALSRAVLQERLADLGLLHADTLSASGHLWSVLWHAGLRAALRQAISRWPAA